MESLVPAGIHVIPALGAIHIGDGDRAMTFQVERRGLGDEAEELTMVCTGFLDELAEQGFAWIYFLSVWQTGDAGCKISPFGSVVTGSIRQIADDFPRYFHVIHF